MAEAATIEAHAEHAHPKDSQYWIIAAVLGVVTAFEVALSYVELGNGTPNAVLLLIGMFVKFFLVAGFFMHLRFDNPLLRRLFITGFVLAIFCYLVALSMFRQFGADADRQDIKLVPSGIEQTR